MGFEEYYTDYIEGLDQVSDNDEIACRAYNAGLAAAAVIAESDDFSYGEKFRIAKAIRDTIK